MILLLWSFGVGGGSSRPRRRGWPVGVPDRKPAVLDDDEADDLLSVLTALDP